MTFLRMLESVRTPFWDQVAGWVTYLGDETFFMLVGLALVWCFDKRWGFRLLFVGLAEESEILTEDEPLTYAYYRNVIKGKTPKNAPSYQGE